MTPDELSKEELEKMKENGFALLGDFFKDTLAYVQIERLLKELEKNDTRRI